jgi:class 3 adenylate cyclase
LSAGDFSSRIELEGNDEFSELGKQFNKMVADIDTQQHKIEEQSLENERLMLNFIPETIVARLQKGEKNIANTYSNVTLIAVDVVGFSELTSKIGAREAVTLLNHLIDAFDTAGQKHHVEKLRTVGDTYFAACGLFSPRLDHAKRVVDFAKELKLIIGQFNINHQLSLSLEFGIHSGEVTAGIIGTKKFNYDLFGQTVNNAFHIKDKKIKNGILVSNAVYERTKDFFEFQKLVLPDNNLQIESIWMYKNDK